MQVQEDKEDIYSKIEKLQPLDQTWEWWNCEEDDIYDILYNNLLYEISYKQI